LNEETVIRASVTRLLSIPGDDYSIMVIDDGSTTAPPRSSRACGTTGSGCSVVGLRTRARARVRP
jgi:hypothetical protein